MSQIICPISGEILYKSDLFLGFDLADVHPIFKAKKELILTPDIIFRFNAAKSYREKALYYLAVINTTGLVDFRRPARPNGWIVEQTFLDACTLAQWIDYARHKVRDLQFPRYVVDLDNMEMKNVSIWLSHLYDIRNLFLEKGKEEDLKKELNELKDSIEKEFKRASAVGRAFTPQLARWALELSGVEEGVFEKWRNILTTPLEDAWTLQKEDLEEILDHLRAELPVNNDQVIAVVHQVKLLLGKSKEGYTSWTFVEEEEQQQQRSTQVRQILKESSEAQAPLIAMEDLPPEPKRSDFLKHWEYLKAKAGWELLRDAAMGVRKGEYEQF